MKRIKWSGGWGTVPEEGIQKSGSRGYRSLDEGYEYIDTDTRMLISTKTAQYLFYFKTFSEVRIYRYEVVFFCPLL